MQETNRLKLSGGLEKTATWIWMEANHLKVEFYDFSETAQSMFGNDIAYTITVKEMTRLLSITEQTESSLVPWMAEKFQSYFGIKKWLEENEISYETERESWA
jgi:hypothetical protein